MVPALNLDALDGFDVPAAGNPLMLDLALVHEDPNQPRKTFHDIPELAASIAICGVKVPISVRPHPEMPGHYMVKFGARRRRGAIAAGLAKIPAFLDEVPSDFEQVVENLQRSDLTAMELADFVAEKLRSGMKASDIARKLSINKSAIVKLSALIDPPSEIDEVYRSRRSTSPATLYELRSALSRFPDQTRAWLAEGHEVSRAAVAALKQELSGLRSIKGEGTPTPKSERPELPALDPEIIKRPFVAVRVGERLGVLVLSRQAPRSDHVLVEWDDTAEVAEVLAHEVRVIRVADARRYKPINRGGAAARSAGGASGRRKSKA